MAKFSVGQRVAYSKEFLQNIGMITDRAMGTAKGTISALKAYDGMQSQIASITWENGADMPKKVNTCNLRKIAPKKEDNPAPKISAFDFYEKTMFDAQQKPEMSADEMFKLNAECAESNCEY